MPVAMRLMRRGTIHNPVYRISVADSRKAPTAKFFEHIGTYNPRPDKMGHKQLRLNVARAKYWIAMGCQPSAMVSRLLSRFHLIPTPPQRITVPTGPLLHRVLAGEDVRAQVSAIKKKAALPLPLDPAEMDEAELEREEREEDERQGKVTSDESEEASAARAAQAEAKAADKERRAAIKRRVHGRLTGQRRRAALLATGTQLPLESRAMDAQEMEDANEEAEEDAMDTPPLQRMVLEARDIDDETGIDEAYDPDLDPVPADDPTSTAALLARLKPRKLSSVQRHFREPTLERIRQLQKSAPWKLQLFPFQPQPSFATEAAWEQARRFHDRIVQYPLPATGRSHRNELKNALARERHRAYRAEDAAANRTRTPAMQQLDAIEDEDEIEFQRYIKQAAGEEDSVAADADRVTEAKEEVKADSEVSLEANDVRVEQATSSEQ